MFIFNMFLFLELSMICKNVTHINVPNTTITNGLVTAKIYLPDANDGYYRSTRFDWGGIVPKLEYQGHNYFGQWFEKYDPKKHDAICGPVDEFAPIGYEDAKVEETFLKIGIGMLRKSSDEPYNSFKYYEIENQGSRIVKVVENAVEFIHILADSSGYSYEYRKTICLKKGKPELVISYQLKNTGKRQIKTTVYNHNFFCIDAQQTGPDIIIQFPVKISGEGRGIGDIARIHDNKITFLKSLRKTDRVYIENLTGFEKTISGYSFSIENHRAGAGVRVTGNRPLHHFVFWSCSTTSCPEPYILINIEPLQKITWENKYEFYTF